MRKGITRIQAIVLVAVVAVAAIVGAGSYYYLSQPVEQVPTEIKIGVSIAMSGWASTTSRPALDGYLMGQDYVNQVLGGIYVREYSKKLPLNIIYYDDQSDPNKAYSNYEKLMSSDGVVATLGPWSSTMAYPCTVLAERYAIPMLCFGAYSDKIWDRGMHYIFNPDFIASANGAVYISSVASAFPQLKTVAMIVEDQEYTRTLAKGIEDACKKNNMSLVYEAFAPSGTKDFSPQILQIKALAPDIYIDCQYAAGDIEVVKELYEYNVNTKLLGCVQSWDLSFLSGVESLGNYIFGHGRPIRPFDAQAAFLDKHEDVFPNGSDIYTYAWDRMNAGNVLSGVKCDLKDRDTTGLATLNLLEYPLLLKQAIETAGTLNSTEIRNALAGLDTYVFTGPLKFNGAGVNAYVNIQMNQIMNETFVCYYPFPGDQAVGDLVLRPDWSQIVP